MSKQNGTTPERRGAREGQDGERGRQLAQELSAVGVRYSWRFGEGARAPLPEVDLPDGEAERLRADLRHLTSALEDIVTLALSSADYKERAIMMHRRAVAALSRLPRSASDRSAG